MRLLILSDLHLEFGLFETPDPALFDVAVLAGDIWPGPKPAYWARRPHTFAGKPVVLVPGNHEFYGGDRLRTLELLREAAAGSNVHLLDRDQLVIDGVRFVGATFWTDFAVDETRGMPADLAMVCARRGLNDFSLIREGDRRFTPTDALLEHKLSRRWLQEQLDVPADEATSTTVVVTHHAPSRRSMDPIFEGSDLNPCFSSELPESFFGKAALWIHGHMHNSSDYAHHGTRVVANPRGYVRWDGQNENKNFRRDLVIEIASGGQGTNSTHGSGS